MWSDVSPPAAAQLRDAFGGSSYASGRALDPGAVRLAVIAAVRHEDTRYETC